jgi:hypothetical protein
LIRWGKELPDIPKPTGPKDRVGNGVKEHISVGMTIFPPLEGNVDSPKDELSSLN